jgi:hypothetical protein
MERVRFFDHDGHRILLLDCTDCGPDELLEVFEQARLAIAAEPPHSLLTLTDFTGAQFNKKVADQMKITATYNRAYVRRSAIVGAEDLPDVYYHNLVSFSAREFPAFKTREEAMDWLVSDKAERAKTG